LTLPPKIGGHRLDFDWMHWVVRLHLHHCAFGF
jgi:hypothetical protein